MKRVKHGTAGGYYYRGCRCAECRAYNAAAQRRHAEKQKKKGMVRLWVTKTSGL